MKRSSNPAAKIAHPPPRGLALAPPQRVRVIPGDGLGKYRLPAGLQSLSHKKAVARFI